MEQNLIKRYSHSLLEKVYMKDHLKMKIRNKWLQFKIQNSTLVVQ
jgi:hypothetical protein